MCASRLNPPFLGSTSSRRWIVFASNPVASLIRLAARPVGAHSRISTPLADRMRRIELTIVVLPTPGPPVMTETLEESAARTASAWPGARASPVLPSAQGRALPGSMSGHGRLPAAIPRRRPAIAPLGPVQAAEEYAGDLPHGVGNHRAFGQLQAQRGADQLAGNLQEFGRERSQLFFRQAAVTLVHRFGQGVADARTDPDHGRLRDAELHRDGVGGHENRCRGCRARGGYGFSVMTSTASAP